MGYYDDLKIGGDLYEEWTKQPILYMNYAERGVDAQDEWDHFQDRLDLIEAKLDIAIRDGSYPLLPPTTVKLTESAIKSLIITDKEVQVLKHNILEAKKEACLFRKAEKAFEQRRDALEKMVYLSIKKNFAEPRENGTIEKLDKILESKNYERI